MVGWSVYAFVLSLLCSSTSRDILSIALDMARFQLGHSGCEKEPETCCMAAAIIWPTGLGSCSLNIFQAWSWSSACPKSAILTSKFFESTFIQLLPDEWEIGLLQMRENVTRLLVDGRVIMALRAWHWLLLCRLFQLDFLEFRASSGDISHL